MVSLITGVIQNIFSAAPGDCLNGLARVSFQVDPLVVVGLQLVDEDTNNMVWVQYPGIVGGSYTWTIPFGVFDICALSMPASPLRLRVELVVFGLTTEVVSSVHLQPIDVASPPPPPGPSGQEKIVVYQQNGYPAPGAVVVVDLIGLPLNLGGYHAEATTDINGVALIPQYGLPAAGSTAEVYVNWTDSAKAKWYSKGELGVDLIGNFTPNPLLLHLTPGSVTPPGPNPFDVPWWVYPLAIGVGGLVIVSLVRPSAATNIVLSGTRAVRREGSRLVVAARKKVKRR